LDEINGTNDSNKTKLTRSPTPEADKKPTARKTSPEGTPSSSLKGRKLNFKPIPTSDGLKAVPEASTPAATDDDEYMDFQGERLLSGRKDDLGKKTPPLNESMDTSTSGSSKSTKSSVSKSEKSKDSEATADSAERRYEEKQRRTLKSVGTRSQPRRSKRLQDDGYKEVDDEDDDEGS
jgi:hypothetical protein